MPEDGPVDNPEMSVGGAPGDGAMSSSVRTDEGVVPDEGRETDPVRVPVVGVGARPQCAA